jgi:hypothetical protein
MVSRDILTLPRSEICSSFAVALPNDLLLTQYTGNVYAEAPFALHLPLSRNDS